MDASVILSGQKITKEYLTSTLKESGVEVLGFYEHSKASESYVVVRHTINSIVHIRHLPYNYRRTNTHITNISDLCDYTKKGLSSFSQSNISQFVDKAYRDADEIFGNATVTLPIFKKLLESCGKWVCNKEFNNPNSQRRIQDIKERGFTIATKWEGRKTFHSLLPFEIVRAPVYETISKKTRARIFTVLQGIDACTGRKAGKSVLPDHKFPEIRWDKDTADSNEELTDIDIKAKFQLVLEQINQTKREICRECYQTNKRGKFSNINFYYSGDESWPVKVPKKGKGSEKGCIGCFWYDMSAWRAKLNELIGKKR